MISFLQSEAVLKSWSPKSFRAATRRLRLAFAVAHEHARRLGVTTPVPALENRSDLCRHSERPEACWPCYVEANNS